MRIEDLSIDLRSLEVLIGLLLLLSTLLARNAEMLAKHMTCCSFSSQISIILASKS